LLLVREPEASDRRLVCASQDLSNCAAAHLVGQEQRAALPRLELLLRARQVQAAQCAELPEQPVRLRVLRQQVLLLVSLRQLVRVSAAPQLVRARVEQPEPRARQVA
jgi:hypothetical protein